MYPYIRLGPRWGGQNFFLTPCVTCLQVGVDSACEQEKLEAWKMLEDAAESLTSGARFVYAHFTWARPRNSAINLIKPVLHHSADKKQN